jgi:ABC-type glycerol-3-phosphate transport system substrate-binding protein
MKRISKTGLCCMLTCMLLLCFLGCSGGSTKQEEEKQPGTRGRYLESEMELPEHRKVFDMRKGEDGRLRIAVQNGENSFAVWALGEDGRTWETVYEASIDLTGYARCENISDVALAPGGGAAVMAYLEREDGEMDKKCYLVDESGTLQESSYEPSETQLSCLLQYSGEGEFYLQEGTSVQKADLITGKSQEIADSTVQTSYFTIGGTRLYAVSLEGALTVYDLEKGTVDTPDKGLLQAVEQSGIDLQRTGEDPNGVPLLFYEDRDEGVILYCGDAGVFRQTKDGNVAEKIIDGSLTSLGSPDIEIKAMETSETGAIYILAAGSEGEKLLKYTYAEEAPTVPEKELKVYSLYENQGIKKAVTQYQKENPNLYIQYEVGMAGDSQKTVSDALRLLGTEIMAGKGPDVLLLDGMPLDSYMEKGILEDVAEIVERVDTSQGLLTNITSAFARDGRLYAVPLRFSVPVVEASGDSLDRITDLKSLADEAERLRREHPEQIIISEKNSGRFMAAQLYDACSGSWITEGGAVEKEKLAEFYEQIIRLHKVDTHEKDSLYEGTTTEYMEYVTNITADLVLPYGGVTSLNFGSIRDASGVAMLGKARQETQDVSFQMFQGEEGAVYLPLSVAGINAKGQETGLAESFLEFLLQETTQSDAQSQGLPVNKKAMTRILQAENFEEDVRGAENPQDPSETIVMYLEGLKQEELDTFMQEAGKLKSPALTDERVREAVLEQANDCTDGKLSPGEAAQKVVDTVQLYLSEK